MKTQAIASSAKTFLGMLSSEQRTRVTFPFVAQPHAAAAHFKGGMHGDVDMVGERYGQAVWSNYPVSDVPRPGLRMGSLTDAQRDSVMVILRELLSLNGYQKVLDIMGADQALSDSGTPYASGRDAYTIAIFGEPSDVGLWMVQFGGHHLALNAVIMYERAVLAPVLTGCLPAVYLENGMTRRALAAENDKAFALLATFDEKQRRQMLIEHPVSQLKLGPGHDDEIIATVGLPASAMTEPQRAMLFDLISEWAGILNDIHAGPRLNEINDALESTHFAWSGPLTCKQNRNGASYFRIHGPNLFIEFSPQEPGGDLTMHSHTIYRDPSDAYGKSLS